MIHPSYTELMEVVNKEGLEDDMPPIVNSRYSIVMATSKRARQIISGDEAMVEDGGRKPLSVAVDELYESKVKIVSDEDQNEDDI